MRLNQTKESLAGNPQLEGLRAGRSRPDWKLYPRLKLEETLTPFAPGRPPCPMNGPSAVLGESQAEKRFVGCQKSLQLLSLSQVSCHLLVSLILKLRQFATASEKLTSPERIESMT